MYQSIDFHKKKQSFRVMAVIVLFNASLFSTVISPSIALDKMLFKSKSIDIFLISPRKNMLWVLIRSTSLRCF